MRTATFAVLTVLSLASAGAAWETPETFKAKDVLTPAEKKGAHHEVADQVPLEGFYYAFELHTDFGDLKPVGLDLLRKRLHENTALEALNEVSKSKVFLDAAGRSLQATGQGLVSVVKDPGATAKGIGKGVKRFGRQPGPQDQAGRPGRDRRRQGRGRRRPRGRRPRTWPTPSSA